MDDELFSDFANHPDPLELPPDDEVFTVTPTGVAGNVVIFDVRIRTEIDWVWWRDVRIPIGATMRARDSVEGGHGYPPPGARLEWIPRNRDE